MSKIQITKFSYHLSCVDELPLLFPQSIQLSFLLFLQLFELSLQLMDSLLKKKQKTMY